MENKPIAHINGTQIVTVENNGDVFVPINPICDALGIDAKTQRDKIQEDEFLSSTGGIIPSVAADGKERDMFCLPLRYVYGWLATINPGKVAPEAKEAVSKYRRECYEVLYNHFTASMQRTIVQNEEEIKLLQEINNSKDAESEAKSARKKAEAALNKLRMERLDPQPCLFNNI
ncbi:MAG: phage antirepressor N-terminal domain-containing protein [Muribaculum sp.]|nr:phage antirepressor N-terminal domain-containing protein [Muribaculum sp.]